MIEWKYEQEEDIIYITRKGKTGKDELFHLTDELANALPKGSDVYILDDLREAEIGYNQQYYPDLIEKMRDQLRHYNTVRNAAVVVSPQLTALTMLFDHVSSSIPNYFFKIFCSVEAAKQWLK